MVFLLIVPLQKCSWILMNPNLWMWQDAEKVLKWLEKMFGASNSSNACQADGPGKNFSKIWKLHRWKKLYNLNICSLFFVVLCCFYFSLFPTFNRSCVTGPPGALVGIVEAFRWLKPKKINNETCDAQSRKAGLAFFLYILFYCVAFCDILKLYHKASLGDTCMLCLLQSAKSPDILSLDLTNAFKNNEVTAISFQSLVLKSSYFCIPIWTY